MRRITVMILAAALTLTATGCAAGSAGGNGAAGGNSAAGGGTTAQSTASQGTASGGTDTSSGTQTGNGDASEAASSAAAANVSSDTGTSDIDALLSSADGRLAKIKEKGVLEVCTEPYFAPNEFIDSSKQGDEQYQGMDIEIAKYIADRLGVQLKIVPLEFSAVLAGIVDGKYDLAISSLAYSPARAEVMRMSKGYYFSQNAGYGFAVRPEDKDKYSSVESLADATVVMQSGSVQEALFDQNVTGCKEKKLVSSTTDAYLAVSEGKADVAICAIASADLYGESNGGNIVTTGYRFDVSDEMSGMRIAACQSDTESLIEFVDGCIDELNAAGQIEEWNAYYTEYAKSLGIE